MGGCYSASFKSDENHSCNDVNLTHDIKEGDCSIGVSNDDVPQLKIFTHNELKTATRNFHPNNMVGEGRYGKVYKGWLDEQTLAPAKPGTGIAIAVKKLKQDGLQGNKEFLTDINFLGQLHHPNIVKLIGYCVENERRLLVFEFLTKGSLDNHLFLRKSHVKALAWSIRMKIALHAAKALAFLHSDGVNVVYQNLKASRVLLDSNFNAKLSDFELARAGPSGDERTVKARVMGPYAYAAPEYITTGLLTNKSNVYTFGVILLEIMSGRPALDRNRPESEWNLVQWAKPYLSSKRRIFQVMDAHIEGEYIVHEVMKLAKIVMQCVSHDAKLRPTMEDVVSALEQLQVPSDEGSSSSYNCGVSN